MTAGGLVPPCDPASAPLLLERCLRDVRDALMIARNTEGKLVRRPLSPHLQVYRWPISMALSISHRVTGVGLAVGTLLLTWWLVAAAGSDRAFANVQGFLDSPIGLLLLFGWSAALIFHFFTGIRHLVWDVGYGFDSPQYNQSGWAVLIATGVCTVLVWIVGLIVW
jgi:succinate dehydrogenase / fumarate reductase, cytochrome b subunit